MNEWAGPQPRNNQHEDILDYFQNLNTDRDELWCSKNVHKTFHTKWAAYDCGSDSVTDLNRIKLLLTSANFIKAHLSRERRETANINFSSKDLSCSKPDFHNYFTSRMRTNCSIKMYRLQLIEGSRYRFREDDARAGQVYCQTEDGLEEAPQEEGEEEDRAPDLEAEESEEIAEDGYEEDSDQSGEEEEDEGEGDDVEQLTAEIAGLQLSHLVPPQNCTNTEVYLKVL